MPTVVLSSITCEHPQETDKDEIYLMIRNNKIWPKKQRYVKIDVDETVHLGLRFKLKGKGWFKIELWEFDLTSKNDHLGTFHLKVDHTSGEFTEMLSTPDPRSPISYFLNWELIQDVE